MSWQLLTFISVLSLSLSVIFQRVLIHKDKVDPFAYVVVFQGLVGIILMTTAVIHGFQLPHIKTLLLPATISILCYGIGHIVYAKTLQKVEASAFSMLFATQSVWTMLLGIILLGEKMTALQIAGTGLIFVSVGIIVRKFHSLFSDQGTAFGLLTGLIFGIATYSWSYVGRFTDDTSWAAISFVLTSLVVLLMRPRSVRKIKPLLVSKTFARLITLALFYGIGSLTMLLAYKYGTFAIVSPLRQTSIVVTVLLALLLLPKERTRIQKKLLSAAVCMVGVVLIII